MFFLTYILQYIFSLSKNTHTCPIFVFVCGFSWQQIGGSQTECVKKQTHNGGARQHGKISERQPH